MNDTRSNPCNTHPSCSHGSLFESKVCKHFDVRKIETYPPWFFHCARFRQRLHFVVCHSTPLFMDTLITNKAFHNKSSISNIPSSIRRWLGLGMKFCPPPPMETSIPLNDLPAFERRVRILDTFGYEGNDDFDPTFHVPKPGWMPEPASIPIETALARIKSQLTLATQNIDNSPRQRSIPRSISEFLANPDILVKPSDKNLGLTIIDKTWYINEGNRQLSDKTFYRLCTEEENIPYLRDTITKTGRDLLTDFAKTIGGHPLFSETHLKYLKAGLLNTTLPVFHMIPKLHKHPMKGRPIVPAHSWITKHFSVWVDKLLQTEVIPNLPFVIRDTKTLINKLDNLPTNLHATHIITGDIESMYTNIDIDKGMDFINHFLPNTMNDSEKEIFLDILYWVMRNNYFSFDGAIYHQINGTAMGTPCAPSFANCYMSYIEYIGRDWVENPEYILFYGRYLDDLLLIVRDHTNNPLSIIRGFAGEHFAIAWEIGNTDMPFLDLSLSAGPTLSYTPYQKVLNKYLYIPFRSYHPETSKWGFIKAELLRFCRNSSSEAAFNKMVLLFYTRLRARGYPPRWLKRPFKAVSYTDRKIYLAPKEKHNNDRILPFVTTLNPVWQKVNLKSILGNFKRDSNIPIRCVIANKIPPNIGKIVNRSNKKKLRQPQQHNIRPFPTVDRRTASRPRY